MGKITEAIKALFTRNTTNAASVSGARVPFVQQDGTPIGNDSLANLASVLGEAKVRPALTSSDTLEGFLGNGLISYIGSSSRPSDTPPGITSEYLVVTCERVSVSFNMYIQKIYTFGSALFYWRVYWPNAGGWQKWEKVVGTELT